MKKKWIALLMAACLSTSTAAGCGSKAQEEGAEPQENAQGMRRRSPEFEYI